jgi:methionyl-tRNA formyltransferase
MEADLMRLVVLTGQDFEHGYVANRLAAAFDLTGIVVDRGQPRSKVDRIRRLLRKYNARQLLSRVIERGISFACRDAQSRREALFRVLGRENCERHLHEELLTRVNGLNTPAARDLIRSLKPDVILVYGTAVVGTEILSLASRLALNMHTGISPYYRGAGCAFWPLYNGELERLGATIHQCTCAIDGGMIYRVAPARLEKDDDLFSVFARCVKVGADLYVQTVRDLLDGKLEGQPQQPDVGREYRAAMKGWRHEASVRWKIRKGLIRDYVTAVREE